MQSFQENVIIYANPEKCLGCHSCELACAVAHGNVADLLSAVVTASPLHARNHVVVADGVTFPMQCRQCEDAPCTFVCPTGACRQSSGQILISEKNCIGCKQCAMVCPFGAITVCSDEPVGEGSCTNRGVAKKCDLCTEWRAKNGKSDTACVEACTTKALRLVNLKTYRQALIEARARELAQSHKNLRMHF